jgi:hypothetical protein
MAAKRTAQGRPLTEQRKARARVVLLTLIALVFPPLAGIRSATIWVCYLAFVILYSLWAQRLATHFARDRRLGYLLCLTDMAILLPLLVWSTGHSVQAVLILVCVASLATTYLADRAEQHAARRTFSRPVMGEQQETFGVETASGTPLERAVRVRLALFQATGARFALVVLRVLRFEENTSYYGEESSQRVVSAVSRRGLRVLGQDAQRFVLPGGRIAFLFEVDSRRADGQGDRPAYAWGDSPDVESLAMLLGRKACEHLVDGHRVECVVGWASAPADGLSADDLMYVAEAGAQSTAAFRRVAGGQVSVPDRARVAAG